jgi:cathepsin D
VVPLLFTRSKYVGDVSIGTPPQYFHLQFDVGSADTWIALTRATCSDPDECSNHRRYFHPNRSSTFEQTPNVPWEIEFSDHSTATGYLQTDLVQVGGFVVDRQVIGMAMTLKGFKENGIDGSFGLGLTELSFHGKWHWLASRLLRVSFQWFPIEANLSTIFPNY